MSELTNVFARNMRDLTTPTSTGVNPNTFDNAKIPIGNAPKGFESTEALTVKQLKELAAAGRKEELDAITRKINTEENRAKEVEVALINDKANKATTLSGYGIIDAYTQGQTDSKVNNLESKKANKVDVDAAFSNLSTNANKYYSTLAAANTDIANIALNQSVTIGEGANAGLWYKATVGATTLTKSAYDPLTQAKSYTDTAKSEAITAASSDATTKANAAEADAKTYTDTSTTPLKENFIVEQSDLGMFFLSADRVPLFYVLNDGSFHLAGDNIDLRERVRDIPNYNSNQLLYEFKDANHTTVMYVTADGSLYLTGVGGSVQDQIAALRNESFLTFKINSIYDSESRSVFSANIVKCIDDKAVKTLDVIEPFPSEAGKTQRIGAALKLSNNKILYFWGGGVGSPYNGDGEGVKLYKRILTYKDDGAITDKGTKTLFRQTNTPEGIAKHPMLGRTKNGRIVLIWDEREGVYTTTNAYTTMIAFSDDEGVSFTTPAVISNNPSFTFQVVGSTGTIITLSTGRMVCPMYYALPYNTMGMMYSDNDGLTWQYGDVLNISGGVLQEPSITFDEDDKIYVSSRSTVSNSMKHLSVSTDGGLTLQDLGFQDHLISPHVASSIYYDFENKLMFHSTPTGSSRNKYKIQMSADKAINWDIAYQPFVDNFYIGYSQIIKLASNMYAVVVEGLQNTAAVNTAENIGIFIFNTKEVFLNVNRN